MRLRLTELMAETGVTPDQVAKAMWPESPDHSRYVSMKKLTDANGKIKTIQLQQLQALSELFLTTNIEKIIEP